MTEVLRLAVFVSGGGTNLQAIIDSCKKPDFPAQLAVVVSNKPGVYGLARAREAGIPSEVVSHRDFPDRAAHEAEIVRRIRRYKIGLVVLAGYMRVVTSTLLDAFYDGKRCLPGVINIHPADTRAYQGTHGYEFALGLLPDYPQRLTETKITVHFVDAGVDTGPVIMQAPLPILPADGIDDLRARGLEVEHRIYPAAIRLYAENKISLDCKRVKITT
ncbi:MAG TPA: phosphoribosylglycinamide formyltransferase [Myxococcota bacterium]|nr:phosphoribosylglycinamide formyltransferase [Myxococcota bacterium]